MRNSAEKDGGEGEEHSAGSLEEERCWAGPHPSHGSLAFTTQEAASSAGSA